ncbi:6826_t:CDS:2, partial [Rhizophagus irregularis]
MRSQKPFKFNKSSKSHMSHKKCNESVSPSPSSKRNKRNSSFDSPSPGRKKTPDIDDKRRSRHSSETRGVETLVPIVEMKDVVEAVLERAIGVAIKEAIEVTAETIRENP